ncbi:head-tail connector protein [Rhodopseudomonas telluris]|uniref:Head-tail connector protein n=1 Tax=Rhodopseudomonas telluris TaxID=644215 RepID=A0ABV6EZN1_9BRAD
MAPAPIGAGALQEKRAMPLVVITQPQDTVVSLDEVKAHLRVDHGDDDDEIGAAIQAAITEFEDPNLGWLGRSISERELELRLDCFPACGGQIVLPNGPLLLGEVGGFVYDVAVEYDDAAGVERTLPDTVYRILDPESARPFLVLRPDQVWPSALHQPQAVRIRYWAGYPADDPRIAGFKVAVKLHVEMTYDGDADRQDKLRAAIDALLQPYRVYRF